MSNLLSRLTHPCSFIERTDNGYSAYVPDLPGCIAAADTKTEVEELIREAISLHLESLHEHGDPIP